jgi:mycoredoxin
LLLSDGEGNVPMSNVVTMYSTTWCGYCRRLKRQMSDAGIDFLEIDIEESQHQHYADRIERETGGYRTVPTLQVRDRLLVNPSIREVEAALAG